MHIELTEMLRCPEAHREDTMVLSTGEMIGRMVRSGLVGCSVCRKEFFIKDGVVDFVGSGAQGAGSRKTPQRSAPRALLPAPADLQALLDLSGPGGFVVLLGDAARFAADLAGLMAGIHFVGVNAPADTAELPVLSLLRASVGIPLRQSFARGVVVGAGLATAPWLGEAHRILLRGRRYLTLYDRAEIPVGLEQLATAKGLWVGEKK